jgi:hypothetical protein
MRQQRQEGQEEEYIPSKVERSNLVEEKETEQLEVRFLCMCIETV